MAIEGRGSFEIAPKQEFEYKVVNCTRRFIAEVNKEVTGENRFVFVYNTAEASEEDPEPKELLFEEKLENLNQFLDKNEKDTELILETAIGLYNDLNALWGHVFRESREEAGYRNINKYSIWKNEREFCFTGEINGCFKELINLRKEYQADFLEDDCEESSDEDTDSEWFATKVEDVVDTALEKTLAEIKENFPATIEDLGNLRGAGFGSEKLTHTSPENTDGQRHLRLVRDEK